MFCFVMVTVVCYDLPIQTKGWHSKGYITFFLADDVSASKIGAWPRAAFVPLIFSTNQPEGELQPRPR